MSIEKFRKDFPILERKINGKPITYFDNACVTLKPKQVVEAMNAYYYEHTSCGGRSHHTLAKEVEEKVDDSRVAVKNFFNAKKETEIVFTRNTTESINLVANSLNLKSGDAVLATDKEHNSNLVPWIVLKERRGVDHKIFRFNDLEDLKKKLDKNVKLVTVIHSSNVDGTTLNLKEVIRIAHDAGALVLVDGAQSAPHKEIDLKKLDADFFACSIHKMAGPSGMGILYGKQGLLDKLNPFMVGGNTVVETHYGSVEFQKTPQRFEAGLQNFAGIIGTKAALEYLKKVGLEEIEKHEHKLNQRITEGLLSDVQLIGPEDAKLRSGIFSFNIRGMSSHEIAQIVDSSSNIMIRSGAHCVHSWFNANNLKGSARASLYFYNTLEECDLFVEEMIPVRIYCSEENIDKIIELTLQHYN
ncbi:aminotransferase class V-fold PLP-dependent enzyme, partial [Candidatus Woesearchaeota archaeon]|nr:aminotransferase class V-fold PLP-dependent enzyme [Candidatus Woesearchaeota archaeon]